MRRKPFVITTDQSLNIFLHISKTAGTTVRHILKQNYSDDELLEIYPSSEHEQSIDNLSPEVKMVIGHIDWSCVKKTGQNAKVFSMLRHPVDQVISHFVHLQSSGDLEVKSFEEFLNSYRGRNWQSQYLSGIRETPEAIEDEGKMLSVAKRNLEKMEFCGITEKFEGSLLLMARILNLSKTGYHHRNRSKDQQAKSELKRKFENEILQLNSADMELYLHADKLLSSKLKQTNFLFLSRFKHRRQLRKYRNKL